MLEHEQWSNLSWILKREKDINGKRNWRNIMKESIRISRNGGVSRALFLRLFLWNREWKRVTGA